MKAPDQQSARDQTARQKASHSFETNAGYLSKSYRDGAGTYDLDLGRMGYCGPTVVAELAAATQTAYFAKERAVITILDAGCGTGLVGLQLKRLGFQLIDGIDLFEEMAEKARQTRVYRHVRSNVDLNGPLPTTPARAMTSRSAAASSCSGMFDLRGCANWLASRAQRDLSSRAPARAMWRPQALTARCSVCRMRAFLCWCSV